MSDNETSNQPSTDRGRARGLLLEELEQVVGERPARRADVDVDRAVAARPRGVEGSFLSSRLMLVLLGAALLTAGVVVSLATGSWVWFGVALGVHLLFTTFVVSTSLALTRSGERPSPTTVSALEREGVADPEAALNDLIAQVDQRTGRGTGESRGRFERAGDRRA